MRDFVSIFLKSVYLIWDIKSSFVAYIVYILVLVATYYALLVVSISTFTYTMMTMMIVEVYDYIL